MGIYGLLNGLEEAPKYEVDFSSQRCELNFSFLGGFTPKVRAYAIKSSGGAKETFPREWTVYAGDQDDQRDVREIHKVDEHDNVSFNGPWSTRIFIVPQSDALQNLGEFRHMRFEFTRNGGADTLSIGQIVFYE